MQALPLTTKGGKRRATWRRRARVRPALLLTLFSLLLTPLSATAQYAQPPQSTAGASGLTPAALKDIGIDQRLNEQLPLDAVFHDETGQAVRLGDYFGQKPVFVSLVYYNCPMLCNQVLNGMVSGLKMLPYQAGKEFDVLTISFDPSEGETDAAKKKEVVLRDYGRRTNPAGWHFLTGDKAAIDQVAQAVGFKYFFDEQTRQYAHASGIMLATPQGRLSHYFYGIEYAPRDLRFGLIEASAGKIGSPVDKLVLYCYHYDPTTGRYGAVIMNIMRLGSIATVFGIIALIVLLRRRRPEDDETNAAPGAHAAGAAGTPPPQRAGGAA